VPLNLCSFQGFHPRRIQRWQRHHC
jgi:hypothetical protein